MKKFRNGILGALMDVYEKAAADLIKVMEECQQNDYEVIVDGETSDDDCRSIQTIISHVVYSGYGYADYLRSIFKIPSEKPKKILIPHNEISSSLNNMILYTEKTLQGNWQLDEEYLAENKIISRHGPVYDMEQIFEHAIVHILRHRRQIEKFYQLLK